MAPIDGIIDLGQVPYLERVLEQAKARGAAVLLPIDTLGGRLDAAVEIRDRLLGSPVRTIAFVEERAISAGALIALAAQDLVMAPGATIGAATPVRIGQGGESQPVDEKTVSYVRKEFRATAENRGRPVRLAEAMVDKDVDLPGLAPKGKLLTLTTTEAIERGLAEARAPDRAGALRAVGLPDAAMELVRPNWAERVVRWLTHPILSSLLMTIAMFGILIELRTPGVGIPGLVGLLSLAAFFWGHWLVHLVGWEELLLVGGGIVLLLVEVFAIPGFGVAGILGILAILAGLTASLLGGGASVMGIASAAIRVTFSLSLAVAGAFLLFRFLPKLPFAGRLVLSSALPSGEGEGGENEPGAAADGTVRIGRTLTPLRPAGTADLAGRRVDVISEGEWIDAGEAIEVLRRDGNRVVVRRAPAER